MTIEELSNDCETAFKCNGEKYVVTYYPNADNIEIETEIQHTLTAIPMEVWDHITKWLDKRPTKIDQDKEELIQLLHNHYVRRMQGAEASYYNNYLGWYYEYHPLGQQSYWAIYDSKLEVVYRTITTIDVANWLLKHTKGE